MFTGLAANLTEQQIEWLRQGLVSLTVPVGGDHAGMYVARGARGMEAVGRSPVMAIDALRAA